ncbi:hypothetical protein Tco_0714315 [Tanacetum coccineum]
MWSVGKKWKRKALLKIVASGAVYFKSIPSYRHPGKGIQTSERDPRKSDARVASSTDSFPVRSPTLVRGWYDDDDDGGGVACVGGGSDCGGRLWLPEGWRRVVVGIG